MITIESNLSPSICGTFSYKSVELSTTIPSLSKYVILARRHGDKWYIAGVNAQKETLKLKVNLPMFSNGEKVRLFSDDKALQGGVKQIEIGKKQELQLAIPCNGGVLITR